MTEVMSQWTQDGEDTLQKSKALIGSVAPCKNVVYTCTPVLRGTQWILGTHWPPSLTAITGLERDVASKPDAEQ